MPKMTYSAAKGLVQAAGSGFNLNSITSVSGTESLDSGTVVTIATAASTLTLPASADSGAFKIILVDQGAGTDNVVIKATNASLGSDATLNATGEFAICVFNGTEWIVGVSTS